jgi:hypothetical protein
METEHLMSPKRAAAWTLVGALAVAWFASAAGVIGQPWRSPRAPVRSSLAHRSDPVSFDVEAQAERLRRRLATAPTPQPVRNPFVFAARQPVPARSAARPVAPPPATEPVEPVEIEPPLTLIGVAEDGEGAAVVRTAMIAGPGDELILARVGQTVGDRYTVTAIGADAVDLKDETSNRTRRLVLR